MKQHYFLSQFLKGYLRRALSDAVTGLQNSLFSFPSHSLQKITDSINLGWGHDHLMSTLKPSGARVHLSHFFTCVAHVIVKRSSREVGFTTAVTDGIWITTELAFGSRWCISTKISRFHGWCRFPAWVITGFLFIHPLEYVVEPQDMSYFMYHGICMTWYTIVGRIQDHSTWNCK